MILPVCRVPSRLTPIYDRKDAGSTILGQTMILPRCRSPCVKKIGTSSGGSERIGSIFRTLRFLVGRDPCQSWKALTLDQDPAVVISISVKITSSSGWQLIWPKHWSMTASDIDRVHYSLPTKGLAGSCLSVLRAAIICRSWAKIWSRFSFVISSHSDSKVSPYISSV